MYIFSSRTQSSRSHFFLFFFNDTATTEIYTLSLHDALPICMMPDRTISEAEFSVGCVSEEDKSEIGFDPAADNPRTQQQPESQPSTSSAQPHSAPNSVKIINHLNQQIVKLPVTLRHKQMNDAISHLVSVQLGGIHAM